MVVEVHFTVAGGEVGVIGAALELEVALGFYGVVGLVVDDLIGIEDVVLVVEDDFAFEGPVVAAAGLMQSLPADGCAGLRYGLGDGKRQDLLAGIVGNFRGNGGTRRG
jgi:hypothetical protein